MTDSPGDPTSTSTLGSGRYVLGERLGRGGMADVHRARDTLLGREVAVKLLRDTSYDATDRARLLGEATTLASLSHPALVTVLDAGFDHDHPFLVLQLVDGPSLGVLIGEGRLDPARVADLGTQVAEALAYAHARGVVHRDVKPANILLDPEGRAHLADFGIARLVGDQARLTQTGQAIGTAAYLAPEQVTGGDLNGAMDVYALGLVLLESLTATRAYPGSPAEAALARLHRSAEVPPDLPPAWRELILGMTRLEPAERPGAAEVAARLRVLAGHGAPAPLEPAEARAPGAAEAPGATPTLQLTAVRRPSGASPETPGVRPRGRGRRVLAAVVVAVTILVLTGLAVSLSQSSDGGRVPDGTPSDLRGPLGDLHDAIEGD